MWIYPCSYPLNGFSWAFKMLKPMSFRELNPEPPAPGVWNLWHWFPVKLVQIENSLQNDMWIYPHKQVFTGFESLKSMSFRGPPDPRHLPGGWSFWWTVHGMRIYCEINIKLKLIKLQFNIITNMLRHIIEKSMKARTWSKLRPERLGVIVWIFPSETGFLGFFKS